MRIIKYYFMILILIFACKSNVENPILPNQKSYIIPLNVGNQWQGTAERIGNNGEIISTFPVSYSIVGTSSIDSTELFIIQYENNQQINCLNTESGFYYNLSGHNVIQYKYPAMVGEKYSVSSNSYREIISVDTLINTEYGKFKCYQYSWKFYNDTLGTHTEQFISPNFGFIYQEHYQTDGPTPQIFLYSKTFFKPIIISSL